MHSETEEASPFALDTSPIDLTLVIPVLNEVDNLRPLVEEIVTALDGEHLSYEVLFIDDGSNDGSYKMMQTLHQEYPQVGMIRFRRNFGQTAAFAAGFDKAQGQVIVTIDADGQNDPADIPLLLAKMEEGYDVVNGWRQQRQDGFLLRKVPSYFANRLIARATGVKLHDRGCSLRAYSLEVANDLHLYGEMHRYKVWRLPHLPSHFGLADHLIPQPL
jgi:glycosyltransferase involved in cell wall biosynthesis